MNTTINIAMTREQDLQIGLAIGLGMLKRLLNQDLVNIDEYKLMVKEFKSEFTKIHNEKYKGKELF